MYLLHRKVRVPILRNFVILKKTTCVVILWTIRPNFYGSGSKVPQTLLAPAQTLVTTPWALRSDIIWPQVRDNNLLPVSRKLFILSTV